MTRQSEGGRYRGRGGVQVEACQGKQSLGERGVYRREAQAEG